MFVGLADRGWGERLLPACPEKKLCCDRSRYRSFALAPAFLRQEDIEDDLISHALAPLGWMHFVAWEAIAAAAKHASVKEINDRKGYLAFKHRFQEGGKNSGKRVALLLVSA